MDTFFQRFEIIINEQNLEKISVWDVKIHERLKSRAVAIDSIEDCGPGIPEDNYEGHLGNLETQI